mgnify:CR=1 FL=1
MNFDFSFYWTLFVRRLPMMTLFMLLFSGLGVVAALNLPETYSTSARLLLEAPQIPDSMVRSTVQTNGAEQLDVIEQRLMTRANLIDIANRFDVFEDLRDMEPDNVEAAMRAATSIQRRGAGRRGGGATMLIISFEARSPRIVASVVNEYVTLVLQENSRFRVARAENTMEFFAQEVERLDQELSQRNVEIARFKSENADALPQDQAYRLERQRLLQDRLNELSRELRAAQQQRDELDGEFVAPTRSEVTTPSDQEMQLMIGRAEAERLIETYGENNPRVIRLNDRLERLEAVVAAEKSANVPVVAEVDSAQGVALLEAARAEADRVIAVYGAQIDLAKAEVEELMQNIAASASNALKLEELERDYEIVQTRYGSAVSNLHSARMGERLEATAQGQRINVIENASVPQVPSGPNRILIAAIGIITGLSLAAGYFVLLEVLNRTIRRPEELSSRFEVMPLATIPYMESRSRRFMRRSIRLITLIVVLVCVPAALFYVDTNYLPLEVIVQRSLAKLGLG